MSPQSHSYGTGSRPERAPSRLPIVLLGLFLLTQLVFVLYLQSEKPPTAPTEASENLAQMFEHNATVPLLCADSCGLGLELSELSEAQQRYWALPSGVFVESVTEDGKAYAAGLREGDILVSINDAPTPDLDTARELLASLANEPLRLTYYRNQVTTTVIIPLS